MPAIADSAVVPTGAQIPADQVVISADALGALVDALHARGYTVVGPTVQDGAIVLGELGSADELPYGWGVTTDAGRYRLVERADRAVFAHAAGPQSWKKVLHPPRARLWSADRQADGTVVSTADGTVVSTAGDTEQAERPRYALLGVRPCDLCAIGILDRVLIGGQHADPVYGARRDGVFVVAVDCTQPSETCFCVSVGGGPGARTGFDLALTEVLDDAGHRFLARAGSAAGVEVLADVRCAQADAQTVRSATEAVAAAADAMGRAMPAVDLHDLLTGSRNSPHWTDVARRCLTCGNCTLVCPTCFCTTTEEVTDLTGEHAQRWRVWDSCFALDFTYLHGGEIRTSGESRYRQWISHKLGNWYDQFGSSGCVGCGRCVAWCPAGIDITAEAAALAALDSATPATADQRTEAGS